MTFNRKRTSSLIALVLFLGSAILFGKGIWIYGKAAVAQVLLERAWQAAKEGKRDPRPWPWADTFPVARLTLEGSKKPIIVLAGASGRTMAFGPGHLHSSAMPGAVGNCVISAHRDTHFKVLRDARPGQRISLETPRGSGTYTILQTRVVHETDTRVLAQTPRGSFLTLITCYPFDQVVPGGPMRFVVIAERI